MLSAPVLGMALMAFAQMASAVPTNDKRLLGGLGQTLAKPPLIACYQTNCSNPIADIIPLDLNSLPLPPLFSGTFDYIIVGAGTAGAALASRLSENPAINVAVLEAGLDYVLNPISFELVSTPGFDVLGCGSGQQDFFNNAVDWGFVTAPQTSCGGRTARYARGKTLGGSSTRNFMLYQRPNKGAMDNWADLTGDKQWNWQNTYPDFKKSPQFTPPNHALRQEIPEAQYNPAAWDPTAGPLQVSYPNTPANFSKFVQLSMNEVGIPTAQDFNSGVLDGVQYSATTINPKGGHRSDSRASFLSAAAARPNLKVFSGALAKKIIFSNDTVPRATGVKADYLTGTDLLSYTLTATKEVIVSAGAFQSPQLLMVSGIGPRDQLTAQNIPILVENPNVGQGMQDHVFAAPTYEVDSGLHTFTQAASDVPYAVAQFLNYTTAQLGPFTNNVADMLAWVRIPLSTLIAQGLGVLASYPKDWPFIEYFSAPGVIGDWSSLFFNNFAAGTSTGKQYASILAALVAPQSRGTVTITSADTAILPVIDPKWLSDPVDQKVAVIAFKQARSFFQTKAMKQIRTSDTEYLPGPTVQTDAQILDWYGKNLLTVWHASCTNAMGKNNKTSVLDSNMRVWGTQGLRVVDASSFPQLPPGHPMSTIYMLAERAATLLRKANNHA